jgi:hypothetical protein
LSLPSPPPFPGSRSSPKGQARVMDVTGISDSSKDVGFVTLAYDRSSGSQLWVARPKGSSEYAITLAAGVSPDGTEFFVAGRSLADFMDVATVAYGA